MLFLGLLGVIALIHVAYICSRMVNRFRGLVAVWILVVSVWLIFKFAALVQPLLSWLPSLGFDVPLGIQDGHGYLVFQVIYIPSGIYVGLAMAVFGLFALANWLWARHIEIV